MKNDSISLNFFLIFYFIFYIFENPFFPARPFPALSPLNYNPQKESWGPGVIALKLVISLA